MAKPATYFRVAKLLTKHGPRGTFYVPKTARTKTITEAQIRELSLALEIDTHTLEHIALTRATDQKARRRDRRFQILYRKHHRDAMRDVCRA